MEAVVLTGQLVTEEPANSRQIPKKIRIATTVLNVIYCVGLVLSLLMWGPLSLFYWFLVGPAFLSMLLACILVSIPVFSPDASHSAGLSAAVSHPRNRLHSDFLPQGITLAVIGCLGTPILGTYSVFFAMACRLLESSYLCVAGPLSVFGIILLAGSQVLEDFEVSDNLL